jgi:tyrosyl-tRNA synthetase
MTPSSATPDTSLYADLEFRGLVKQSTSPDLPARLAAQPLTLYCGFDPTADSLHVGSLLPLLTLRRFQNAGHRVIALVGGATGMIGDPSGKSQERKLQTVDDLRRNVEGIRGVVSRFLRLDGPNPALVTNNHDWFSGLSYLEFLRDVGKHFTVNHMMAKESVRARLEDREHGISYTEFSYMLLQAYDYVVLNEREGCTLQIGGSDQWGNITAGIELLRRMRAHRENKTAEDVADTVYGFTMPLVMKADGTKFGKSESGTVWLSEDRTTPYQLYQFFLQTADVDVGTMLRYFTFLPRAEIERLEGTVKTAPEKREAQTTLAREMVKLVHGEAALERATQASQALFGTEIRGLSKEALLEAFSSAPTTRKALSALDAAVPLVDLLVEGALANSKGAARKEIAGGGVYLNNERVSDAAATVSKSDLLAGFAIVLRRGKKSYHLFRFD